MKFTAVLLALAAALASAAAASAAADASGRSGDLRADAIAGDAPSALASDTTFDDVGYGIYDFNDAAADEDIALRVFPASDGGYWLAGYQRPQDVTENDEIAVVKLTASGAPDPAYGSSGKLVRPSSLYKIADVAIGDDDRLYFTGAVRVPGYQDDDFGVQCFTAAGAYCAGFGNYESSTGTAFAAFDQGGSDNDRPARIVHLPGAIYVTGSVDVGTTATPNLAVGIAKWSADTGQPAEEFSNVPGQDGQVVHDVDFVANGDDSPHDMAVADYGKGAVELVIVGKALNDASTNDYDGFVMELDTDDGDYSSTFNGGHAERVFFDLSPTDKYDSLEAVTMRADGGLLLAGESQNDDGTETATELTLTALDPFGVLDDTFGDDGSLHGLLVSSYQFPSSIVERRAYGDFVVAMTIKNDLFGDGLQFQPLVAEFDRDGDERALAALAFAAAPGVEPTSEPTGMIRDSAGRIVLSGWRFYDPTTLDFDMFAARFVDDDTIFADGFQRD